MPNLLDPERRLRAALISRADRQPGDRLATQEPGDGDDDLIGLDGLDRMLADVEARPDEVLAFARRTWDGDLSLAELRRALIALRATMELARHQAPEEIVDSLPLDLRNLGRETRAAGDLSIGPTELPDDWWPDRPQIGVVIDPRNCKFETDRDWTGWVWHTAGGWLGANLLKRRADFRTGAHDYSMPAGNGFRLALFSDFGTGLYHSQYIAHFIGSRRPDLAVHLGDVYYAGKAGEFETRFDDVLDRHLFRQSPTTKLFCLNANHEMYARARPYFAYVDKLRRLERTMQEGSYFRIRIGQRFQIVAVDTACTLEGKIVAGRFEDPDLRGWLEARLTEGRREGRSTIFLTSDYPHHIGSDKQTALLRDLEPFVQRGLIDMWFWGDSHYGALFFRGPSTPFIGGCLAHGGYPYYKRSPEKSAGSLAAPRFVETRSRFHGTNVRADMGNNGFAFLVLDDTTGAAELEYVDWRDQSRCKEGLVRLPHGLDFRMLGDGRSVSVDPSRPEGTAAAAAQRSATARSSDREPCPCQGEVPEVPDVRVALRDLGRTVAALTDAVAAVEAREAGGREAAGEPAADEPAQRARGGAPEGMMRAPSLAAPGRALAAAAPLDDAARLARALRSTFSGSVLRIVGGTPVRSRNFPSCVFLAGPGRTWSCTGVLISRHLILTAAHCGDGLVEAMLGGTSIPEEGGEDGTIVGLRDMVVHPDYRSGERRNDIAIAILDQPTSLAPVALATDAELAAATDVRLVGYGYNDTLASVGLGVLRTVDVALGPIKTRPDQDHSTFEAAHGYTADTEFVAGRKALGRDSCNGDSGGPAYVWTPGGLRLGGLTSRATRGYERPCGDGGVYTRPLPYVDWIEEVARCYGVEASLAAAPGESRTDGDPSGSDRNP